MSKHEQFTALNVGPFRTCRPVVATGRKGTQFLGFQLLRFSASTPQLS